MALVTAAVHRTVDTGSLARPVSEIEIIYEDSVVSMDL
jgi:hypothetical protein